MGSIVSSLAYLVGSRDNECRQLRCYYDWKSFL